MAHDFNNLLTGIVGYAELAAREMPPDSAAYEFVSAIPTQGKRAADLIASLMTFSREARSERQPLTLQPLVKETGKMLQHTLPETIAVEMLWSDWEPIVSADPTQIQQIIMNLGTNARDAMPEGGELAVELSEFVADQEYCQHYADATPGRYACLSVRDTGHGMPREVQDRIFDPFFTTKPPGEGTGLGLAIVYGIVKDHGGFLHVYSEVGAGTEFRVFLPLTRDSGAPSDDGASSPVPNGNETLLLVEDDEMVLSVGQDMLSALGYTVLTAKHGEEGLETFRTNQDDIALVLTDRTMPKMGGRELYQEMVKIRPDVKALFVSGYPIRDDAPELRWEGVVGAVHKPFDMDTLGHVVREALDTHA